MALVLADIKKQYVSDKNLKEKSVKEVVEWVKRQPHLPNIHEIQAILSLQKMNYQIEDAKKALDTYFTFRSYFSETYLGRNPLNPSLQKQFDVLLFTMLPGKTPEGYSIYFMKAMDSNIDNYDIATMAKYFDMVTSLHLHQEGASKGYILIVDLTDLPYEILPLLSPTILRKTFHDIEEILPWKVTGLHYFNIVPFVSQFVALMKSFCGKKFVPNIHVHSTVEELLKYVPRDCLPQDYGGSVESVSILHERIKKKLVENAEFFDWEDQQTVDETKRTETRNGNYFDYSNSFKNWEID